MSWAELGSVLQRDVRTAIRQMDENSNPQLDTLEQYAAALGGKIHFLPDDWNLGSSEALAEQVGSLKAENDSLRLRVQELQTQSEDRLKRINHLQDLLTKCVEKLLEQIS